LKKLIILILPLFYLAGCDAFDLDVVEKEESALFFKAHLDNMVQGDFEGIIEVMTEELTDGFTPELQQQLLSFIPKSKPDHVVLVGFNRNFTASVASGTSTTIDYTYEYQFGDKSVLLYGQVINVGSDMKISGLNLQTQDQTLKEKNAFNLWVSDLHYFILLLVIALPIYILYALVQCIRTPLPRLKWLWIVVILFGLGGFQFDWTTGDLSLFLFNWRLLGSGYEYTEYGPVILSFSIPVGAVLFLRKRRNLISKELKPNDLST
jgi:hypothetical protein